MPLRCHSSLAVNSVILYNMATNAMNLDLIFRLSSLTVFPFWLLMIFVPRWRGTQKLLKLPWVVAGAALLYVTLVSPHLREVLPVLLRPKLATVAALLGTARGATIAWAHFLAFDLFVGRWIYLDSRRRTIPAALTSPLLALTLMLGPLGLLLYLGLTSLIWPGASDEVDQGRATSS